MAIHKSSALRFGGTEKREIKRRECRHREKLSTGERQRCSPNYRVGIDACKEGNKIRS